MSRRPEVDARAIIGAATALIGAVTSFLATPNALPFSLIAFNAGSLYLLWLIMDRRNAKCDEELRGYKWAFVRMHYAINETPKGKKVNLPPLQELFAPPRKEEEHRFSP